MLIKRYTGNPILTPKKIHSWEAEAVFNPCPVKKGEAVYLLYRALSLTHYSTIAKTRLMVSVVGIAESQDGIEFHDRRRFIIPEENWERFGVEDPRVSKLGDKYYIFYTALSEYPFRAEGIKSAVAITKDMKTIEEKHLVTPFNSKGMTVFPEKIDGKIWALLTVNTDKPPAKMCLVSFDEEDDMWNEVKWLEWYKDFNKHALPLVRRPDDQVEVGAPPIKTKEGWLLIYSYIKNYFSNKPVFGIEAVLLDLKDPRKVIASTEAPIMVPEEYYERIGIVPNIVFPTGMMVEGDILYLYYGAADTTCCLAFIELPALLEKLLKTGSGKVTKFTRIEENPVMVPIKEHSWESKAVFNPSAILLDNKVHIVYRAMSEDNTSVMGYATSSDGLKIDYRSPTPIYVPSEPFEQKLTAGGNSGCEDPRLTEIDGRVYMLYTAFDGRNPARVAMTSILTEDFVKQNWNWSVPVLISPPDIDDKDACVFPEKINGKYFIIHRCGDDIDSAFCSSLDFDGKTWIEEYRWLAPRKGMWDDRKIGLASTPFKTEKGWIMFYHGVSDEGGIYRLGACLLDLKDPTKIIARLDKPVFTPVMDYEKVGIVPNVVFPCGSVIIGEDIIIYYGGADKVIGIAKIKTADLLENLENCLL